MNDSIESRLNFSQQKDSADAIQLESGKSEAYYQEALSGYCEEKNIDLSEDNCSAMIMSDYDAHEDNKYWFWIDG